jgi:hypothetical protein
LLTVTVPPKLLMPPPRSALLPEKVLLLIVNVPELETPPPEFIVDPRNRTRKRAEIR